MDSQINVQKRNRADTVPNATAIPVELDPEETIVVDHPSRTAPDRDIFLAPTENVPVLYYRSEASAIAIWRCFPSKLDTVLTSI
jgi:hypothetical protein